LKQLLLLLLLLTSSFSSVSLAAAQTVPGFMLGFKVLADRIPDVAGSPIENEHYDAAGNSQQLTTTGLMVWRRTDNWTAFTDGSRTWINGPYGVQDRANTDRFDWEAPPPAAPLLAPTSLSHGSAAPAPSSTTQDSSEAAAALTALALINQSRSERGLAPLTMDDGLTRVAQAHAQDMATRNFMAHVNPDGLQPWDRVKAAGISYTLMDENLSLSQGYSSLTDALTASHQAMMAETTSGNNHRATILNARLTKVGIGIATAPGGKVYYVADFTG
jgi:uncharacterized protein YkwD